MSEPFIGEIRVFGFDFAPRGWAFCDGQLLPVGQYTALYSILGTTYGGDGRTSFALPNLHGRAPMMYGRGPGLTARREGEVGGVSHVTLTHAEMPSHTHTMLVSTAPARSGEPKDQYLGTARGALPYVEVAGGTEPDTVMAADALAPAGGSLPHNNLQPYLVLNYCIALEGLFPPRP